MGMMRATSCGSIVEDMHFSNHPDMNSIDTASHGDEAFGQYRPVFHAKRLSRHHKLYPRALDLPYHGHRQRHS